jgi:hypothetical protein
MQRVHVLVKVSRSALATLFAATLAAIASFAPSSAQAITCIANTAWTSTTAANSQLFAIAQNSDCNDLNAAYTYTYNDYLRGWYRDSRGTGTPARADLSTWTRATTAGSCFSRP